MLQKLHIRIRAPRNDSCRRNGDIVATESAVLPFARSEHLRSDGAKLLARDSCVFESRNDISRFFIQFVDDCFALDDFKRRISRTAFFRIVRDDFLLVRAQ